MIHVGSPRVVVYLSLLCLALFTLWSVSLQRVVPLVDASERFTAVADERAEAAAAQRRANGERAGTAAARGGQLTVYEYGLPVGSYSQYERLLLYRYGVHVQNVGCMPTADTWDWQAGFTTAVERELRQAYGRDVFQECRRDAAKLYKSQVKCE